MHFAIGPIKARGAGEMGRVTVAATIESTEDLYRVQRGEMAADQVRRIEIPDALVDTGATALSLPRRFVAALGLLPQKSRRVVTTSGIREVSVFGAVRLGVGGRDCTCDVVEIADECPVLIGQVPLELMDWVVDPGRRQLIGNPAHGGEQLLELL
jgi:predicted aspartyl protease